MKSLVMKGPKCAEIIDAPIPEIQNSTDILIKNRYCGVCMSEHYDWASNII